MEDNRASGQDGTEHGCECQIYVAAPSRDRLMERVAAALCVSLGVDHTMTFGCVDVEWTHNDYEDTGARDDFLNWHSLLMCHAHRGAAPTAVVSDTATVLEAIRAAGYRAVPVCDYDELLQGPWRTGDQVRVAGSESSGRPTPC